VVYIVIRNVTTAERKGVAITKEQVFECICKLMIEYWVTLRCCLNCSVELDVKMNTNYESISI